VRFFLPRIDDGVLDAELLGPLLDRLAELLILQLQAPAAPVAFLGHGLDDARGEELGLPEVERFQVGDDVAAEVREDAPVAMRAVAGVVVRVGVGSTLDARRGRRRQ